jgi:hypothetical protein
MATPETGIIISDAVSFQIKIDNTGTIHLYNNVSGVWVEDGAVAIKFTKLNVTTELATGDAVGITENFNCNDGAKRIKKLHVLNGIVTKLEVENA